MLSLLQKANSPNSSWSKKTAAYTKYLVYSLMHELLQSQIKMNLFFNALIIVEAGQFLCFLWKSDISEYPRDAIKYFQLDSILREGKTTFYYGLLYTSTVIQVVMSIGITAVLVMLVKFQSRTSSLLAYMLRFISLYIQLLTTILPIPMFQVFLIAILCKYNDFQEDANIQCYTGLHIADVIVGIFGIVTGILFTVLAQIFFIDLNPSSNLPLAAPHSNLGLVKLLLKFFLSLYVTLDSKVNPRFLSLLMVKFVYGKTFVTTYSVIWLLILMLRYNSQGYYNSSVTVFALGSESLVFWGALVSTFHAFIQENDNNDIGVLYFVGVAPFFLYTYYRIFCIHKWRMLQKKTRSFKKPIDYEVYINTVRQLVDNMENPEERVELEGFLRYHVNFCRKADDGCPCASIAFDTSNNLEAHEKKVWYIFIRKLFEEALDVFPKNPMLHLQYAYFYHKKLNNRYKSLFELNATEDRRPSIQEEFAIFRYKNIIEKEMMEEDMKNTNIRGIDVNLIVHFQEKFVVLQTQVGKTVNMQLDFWRELCQMNPNVQKLLSLGSKITIQAEVVRKLYDNISELNSSHIKLLQMYGRYLMDVLNDQSEAHRILQKAEDAERSVAVHKNFVDNDRLKYSENTKTCIFTVSANLHTMGKIISANSETLEMLGYVHTDLIGQNISMITPSLVASIHDDLMMKYFETCTGKVMNKERLVFPITKTGYIIPCNLMIKIFPNLDDGLRVVGFLRQTESRNYDDDLLSNENNKTNYILYGGDEDIIFGITRGCYDHFGIPSSLVGEGNPEFNIQTIFPEFRDQEELRNTAGMLSTLDTSNLPKDFLLGRETFEDTDGEEQINEERYKASKVRAVICYEDILLNKHKVKALKFFEVIEKHTEATRTEIASPKTGRENATSLGDSESQVNVNERDLNASRSDGMGSRTSVGSVVGEDIRQLKDIKAKIAEKNAPSSIASLKRISLVIGIILVVISSFIDMTVVQLIKRSDIRDELSAGLLALRTSYKRSDLLAEINTKVRMMDLIANNMLPNMEVELLRQDLVQLLDTMIKTHFKVIQDRIYVNQTKKQDIIEIIKVYKLLLDQSIEQNSVGINKAFSAVLFSTYIAAVQKLIKMDMSAYLLPPGLLSAKLPFYYLQRNGLSTLREGSDRRSQGFLSFYIQRVYDFSEFNLIIMATMLSFLAVCQIIIVPKIFAVNKTNMNVLSLFGYIPPEEINELAEKCEQYMEAYLDELMDSDENNSYDDGKGDQTERSAAQQQDASLQPDVSSKQLIKPKMDTCEIPDESVQHYKTMQVPSFLDRRGQYTMPVKSSPNQLPLPSQEDSNLAMPNKSFEDFTSSRALRAEGDKVEQKDSGKIKKQNTQQNDQEEDENSEYLELRSKKLRNSKNNHRGIVVLKIMVFGVIFMAYFALDYVHEHYFLEHIETAYEHMRIISERGPNLKFTFLFSLEELAEDDMSVVYPEIPSSDVYQNNYRIQYSNSVFKNQRDLKDAFNLDFPDDFDDYFKQLLAFNNQNVCKKLFATDSTQEGVCESTANGQFVRGLVQTEVVLVENTNTALKKLYATSGRTLQTQIDIINSPGFQEAMSMMGLLSTAIEELIDSFTSSFNIYLDEMLLYEKMKFLVLVLMLSVLTLFIWIPYLRNLTNQIFRTKGLLNMIPMELIKKNKTLRETFTSSEIMKFVK